MRSATAIGLFFVAILLVSCSDSTPTGPGISNVVMHNVSLRATAGNTALCCCRVEATAENRNTVPVHLTVKYTALDGIHPDPIATIVDFVPDLEPGTSRAMDTAGFVFPCVAIAKLTTEVDVTGIAFPPL